MKKIPFLLSLVLVIVYGENLVARQTTGQPVSEPVQDRIHQAFITSLTNQNLYPLQKIQTDIRTANHPDSIADYWIPYAKYYVSIYYVRTNDHRKARQSIEEGIDILARSPHKNAEFYALLAQLKNFSLQFEKGLSVVSTSIQAVNQAKKAIRSDPDNPRAWYVLACNDYHTPKLYGGGKKWKEYVQKAIGRPQSRPDSPYSPTWGISDAYALLIGYYLENDQKESARKIFDKALESFPRDPSILQYAGDFSSL